MSTCAIDIIKSEAWLPSAARVGWIGWMPKFKQHLRYRATGGPLLPFPLPVMPVRVEPLARLAQQLQPHWQHSAIQERCAGWLHVHIKIDGIDDQEEVIIENACQLALSLARGRRTMPALLSGDLFNAVEQGIVSIYHYRKWVASWRGRTKFSG